MQTIAKLLIGTPAVLLAWAATSQTAKPPASFPEYSTDGQLRLPVSHREWVYLSSGFGFEIHVKDQKRFPGK